MSKKQKPSNLADLIQRYLRAKEAGKRAYARSDRMLEEIAKEVAPGAEIPLNDVGRKAILKDRFADKNIVWTPCGARRYELEIVEP